MIGIDMTFIRKNEISKGYFSEGVSIYCEQILKGFEKIGTENRFVLLVFKDQEETIRNLFPNYKIRVMDSPLTKKIRKVFGYRLFVGTGHQYIKDHTYAAQTADLECVWFPFAIECTYCPCPVPTVSTIHDLIMYYSGKEKVKRRYRDGVISLSDKIVTISNSVKKEIQDAFGYTKNISVVPNAVEYNEYLPIEEVPEIADKPFILDVNAFTERKNALTLLKAFDLLKDNIKEDLVLCGGYSDKDYYEDLQNYIKSNNLQDRVHVFYAIEEKKKNYLFSKASLFVMPSLAEGFGRSPIEAAMREIPVICTDIPVLREVTLGDAIYYHPPKDENQLANAICFALENSKSNEELEAISVKLQNHYSTEQCAEQYMTVFNQVLAGDNA